MQMNRQDRKGYLMVFLAGALWGTIGMFVEELEAVGVATEMTSFLRLSMAAVLMLVICLVKFGPAAMKIDKGTLGLTIVMGCTVQGLCNLAYSYSVTEMGMSVAVVFMDSAPIYTLFLAAVLFHEKLTSRKLLAVAIDICGCILAATNGDFSGSSLTFLGVVMGLISGFTYALSPILGRYATKRTNPFILCFYCYLFATLFIGLVSHSWTDFDTLSPRALGIGVIFGFVGTVCPYILYYTGVSLVHETSRIPVIASVELIVATMIGVLRYGDRIGIVSVTGIVLIFAAIVLMNRPEKPAEQ